MLDYRTPRTPKTPIETETPFPQCGYWSVQNFSSKYGKWLRICERHDYGAAHEFALGYCAGAQAVSGYKNRQELKYELIWLVGPDGHGYVCFEAPPPQGG